MSSNPPTQSPGDTGGQDEYTIGDTVFRTGTIAGDSNVSAGWSRYDGQNTVTTETTNEEFFERRLPPSTTPTDTFNKNHADGTSPYPTAASTPGSSNVHGTTPLQSSSHHSAGMYSNSASSYTTPASGDSASGTSRPEYSSSSAGTPYTTQEKQLQQRIQAKLGQADKFKDEIIDEEKPSFFARPFEYIFGGNDDDISTIDGGRYVNKHSVDDDVSIFDDSTIATTPTLVQEETQKKLSNPFNEPIIEVDEEDEEDSDEESEEEVDDGSHNEDEEEEEEDEEEEDEQQVSAVGSSGTGSTGPGSSFTESNLSKSEASATMGYRDSASLDNSASRSSPSSAAGSGMGFDANMQNTGTSGFGTAPRTTYKEYMAQRQKSVSTMGMGSATYSSGSSVWDASTINTSPSLQQKFEEQAMNPEPVIEVDEDDDEDSQDESEATPATEENSDRTPYQGDSQQDYQQQPPQQEQEQQQQQQQQAYYQQQMHQQQMHFQQPHQQTQQQQPPYGLDTINETSTVEDEESSVAVETVYSSYDGDTVGGASKVSSIYPDDSASLVGDTTIGGKNAPVLPRRDNATGGSVVGATSVAEARSLGESLGSSGGGSHRSWRTTGQIGYRGQGGARSVFGPPDDASEGSRSIGRRSVRSEGFVLQNRRDQFRREHFGPNGSSMNSLMPLDPVEIKFTEGGPTMTQGMSGRAVVHVSLKSDQDGSIHNLEYTKPVTESEPEVDEELSFAAYSDSTQMIGNLGDSRKPPWYAYYFYKYGLVQWLSSRRAKRISFGLFIGLCVIVAATISTVASIDNAENAVAADTVKTGLEDLRQPPAMDVKLPSSLDNHIDDWFRSNGDYSFQKDDVPMFWTLPMEGGLIIQELMGKCLRFTIASEVGAAAAATTGLSNKTLSEIQVYGSNYINVDTTTEEGINHAKSLNLVPSGMPDVLFTPLLHSATKMLYDKNNKANMIVMMRNPVSRAVALYYYQIRATWDPAYDPKIAELSLEEYASGGHLDNNFVTRFLVNKPGGSLTEDDVKTAKEILRTKAVLGIYENFENSVEHMQRYFSWTPISKEAIACQLETINDGINKESVPKLDAGSAAYSLIKQQNRYDIEIYQYIRNVLFPYQYETVWRQTQFNGGQQISL